MSAALDPTAPHIVIIGDPVDGFRYYGPFPNWDEASDWTETDCRDCDWWIAPLIAPSSTD